MPKGSVEKKKKEQVDASLKDNLEKLKKISLLESNISNLKKSLELRKEEVQKDFNDFVIEIEKKKYSLIREVDSLKKEKESLKNEIYERLGRTME